MDAEAIADLFADFGPVAVRRMFGGAGLYHDGVMFALEASGTLYLKADAGFAADLAAEGSAPFTYQAKGRDRTITSFWTVPERALDDPEALAALARRAHFIAAAEAKPQRTVRAKKPVGVQRPRRASSAS